MYIVNHIVSPASLSFSEHLEMSPEDLLYNSVHVDKTKISVCQRCSEISFNVFKTTGKYLV